MRAPIGHRIRRRRQEIGVTQGTLARRVGISPSYLNLIEHNRRTIGGALLHRIADALDLDHRALAGTEEARLIAELTEMAADPLFVRSPSPVVGAHEIVASGPAIAQTMIALYRAYREMRGQVDLLCERMSSDPRSEEHTSELQSLMRIS